MVSEGSHVGLLEEVERVFGELRNSSNPRQQEIIHDGRVTVQPVQGRQSSFADGTFGTRANISGTRGNNSGQQRVVKCLNCQREGHMAGQCPKPKRKRDATWFRDKVLLVEAQGFGKVLNEKKLEFLADLGVTEGLVTQTVITHNATYQADDLDAYDSDCDDISTDKAVLMSNLSSYGSDVLSKVPHSENTHNDMLNQSVQEMPYSEQTHLMNYPKNKITSDSNIITYSQYLLETQNAAVQDTNSSTQQDAMILSVFEQLSNQVTNCNKVNKDNLIANEYLSAELERYKERLKLLEERQNVDFSTREKLIMNDIIREKNAQFVDFEKEINYLKQTLSEQLKENELLTETFNVLKKESKEKENKNIDKEIALEKKVKELDNIVYKMALGFQNPFYLKKAQQIRPRLYDGSVMAKETNVISIADSEETLMLEKESRSKMILKQSPYQYKQVLEPGDDTVTPPVPDTYRLQNGTELTKTKRKQVEADDQAIHILLVGLLDDVYAVMDSFQTINEMWNRIQRLKKGTKIRIQEKRITLLDELEKFTSIEGETIASLVRISQKSQEYSQNQANTGTRIRRVQSRSQKSPNP
ncbi:retrovirus-related pol polyprotein from transposon TNT 1-94 [Tanacetum coccineum]|uniref:Retrovirus-related pol polyprotein from transposon TNT 1-94 n=1 Tax=Tanacetum coccineum TaxID=301880 RepID=A0ABQ5IQL4_9ASTR